MPVYEYKVVPAPQKGEKAKGAKTTADRFAVALTSLMNQLGRDGWDYVRADTLPCEERTGFTGRTTTTYQNMLVFRRVVEMASAQQPEAKSGLSAYAPEGAAPRLTLPDDQVAPVPGLGPAGKDVAAE